MPGFFDKMKSTITEMGMEASIRGKEALDTQQVKSKIGELENQKKATLLTIGDAVVTMYKNSEFDQEVLTQHCQTIGALEAQIKEKEAEIEALHQRAETALAEQKAAALAGAAQAGAAGGTFCGKCGAALKGARFCPNCGAKAE